MKRIIVLLLCLPVFAGAQSLIGGKNILRWNIGSVALKNYHFTYERGITKHFTLSVSYRTEAKGAAPFQSQLKDAIKSSDINFDNFQIGNNAWTFEGRLYTGKLKGFYVAPYLRFANFDLSAPVRYTNSGITKEANFIGNVKSTSPGLMIGWQFCIATKFIIDLQIIGGHYGHSTGDLNFVATVPLTPQEQSALQQSLNNINPSPFKFTSTVNANGAQIKTDGPWAGVRSNIGIGFRF